MNILILAVYPLDHPRHGGQLRARHIADTYRSAGFTVEVVGVLGSDTYPRTSGFLSCPPAHLLASIHPNRALMADYAIGSLFATDDKWFSRLAAQIRNRPDVINVEQPWLWDFAARFAGSLGTPRPRLVYSSHNVENELKRAILTAHGDGAAAQAAESVRRMEITAIRDANAVICVSDSDARWTIAYATAPVRVASNGVAPWIASPVGQEQARGIAGSFSYALFCSSAHVPNIEGFLEMFGGGFGSLGQDQRLVLVGDAGSCIRRDPRFPKSARLPERTLIAGVVEPECLAALLDAAHCIVLPVTQGGGTNLKTAEALWAGKHIIATTVAMRGFEDFIGSPGVDIANTPAAFKQALRRAMDLPPLVLSGPERARRQRVLWSACLSPLPELLRSISASP